MGIGLSPTFQGTGAVGCGAPQAPVDNLFRSTTFCENAFMCWTPHRFKLAGPRIASVVLVVQNATTPSPLWLTADVSFADHW
jgi:hypothetical protein